MVRKIVEGSVAVAEVVANCEPDVVACYPITPSTHIAEHLADLYADGKLKHYITVEQEFSSLSAIIGASAAGGRAFSATSSQGLALMHEPVFAAAGMRLPVVMVIGNRALSAPLNIWNDWQDSMSERDSGWIQFYCESNQEVIDTVIQAFKVAERVSIPAMVCMDGFFLTHTVEPLDIPDVERIREYLPKRKPIAKLDPENPVSMGEYALPRDYQKFREDLHKDLLKAKDVVREEAENFAKQFGRSYGDGVIEKYMTEDADMVLISMGSVVGNMKETVDEMRGEGAKVGVLRIKLYRPFPVDEVKDVLKGKKYVGVFEKAASLGALPPLYTDVMEALSQLSEKERPVLSSFVGGLGGKDVTTNVVRELFNKIADGKRHVEWV